MNNDNNIYGLCAEELSIIDSITYVVYGEITTDKYHVRLVYTEEDVQPKYKYILIFWGVDGQTKQYGAANVETIKSFVADIDSITLGATVH